VSASVNLTLHHKVQNFCSGTGAPGWFRKKGCKMVVCVLHYHTYCIKNSLLRIHHENINACCESD